MKVQLLVSGGFVGISKRCELDTDTLDQQEASELERLVKQSGVSISGTHLKAGARDVRQYKIVIDDGDQVSVTFDDLSIPQPVGELVDFLQKYTQPKGRN
ncbi:protealysin inhibitor emfourin [Pseudomonas caricapapayae]|uniref:Protealysin inhibitor emfourin n=1 Tax=Pseudomonas caricapapayae TaxID=46678 RepID=A0ACC7LSP7_9PSED